MEVLSVENLEFQYESGERPVLKKVDFVVNRGEMILICGSCGCGKTTLLRLLKEELQPAGRMAGRIVNRYQSERIGYLFQNPDSQIVCETVEEELVFGAENLGMPRDKISRAVAEVSAYLGIESILHARTAELSGGQKQMVNLASLLLMNPKLLLLDEPVSQLDPVSTYEFINLIRKLKEELNMTFLIVEHNMDAFLKEADRVLYLEEGSVGYDGSRDGFVHKMLAEDKVFQNSLPETVKVFLEQTQESVKRQESESLASKRPMSRPEPASYPYTVHELLAGFYNVGDMRLDMSAKKEKTREIICIRDGYFRYEKQAPDILKKLNLSLEKGKIYGLVGGNGAGKSTLFSILSGYRRLYRGKCRIEGKAGVLPQNPVYAFFKDVLLEDLQMLAEPDRITALMDRYGFCSGLKELLDQNPLDLSGGQMQKAAIFKMLLRNADILLMDEPVKAMDGYEKLLFANMLEELRQQGKTILLISHDLEFVEKSADEVLLMFDGQVVAVAPPERMFQDNRFYTTVRGRIRGMIEDESDINH